VQRLNLNHIANKALHFASQHPYTSTTSSQPSFSFLQSDTPTTTATPANMYTPLCTPPTTIPRMVTQTPSKANPLICYQCGQTSHISQDCPQHFNVCHMTLETQDEIFG
jgi:hypothetical protein